ncbi:MAG: hypothetical protein Q4B85_09290 [Lachnospiraceae bacterium]|nr:hypothetical protein [Lachnospiraceae bacterium]
MQNVMDFLTAALPWIGIALFALAAVLNKDIKSNTTEPTSRSCVALHTSSLVCFLFVIATHFIDGDMGGAAVWIALAVINVFLLYYKKED